MTSADTAPTTEAAPESPGYGAWLGGTDHKSVGTFCLVLAFVFLLTGGVLAGVLRTQLAQPDLGVLAAKPYLQLLTFHGTNDFLPITQNENMHLQLVNRNLPAKMLEFAGAGHGLVRNGQIDQTYELYAAQEQILWFRQYLR